MDLDARSLPDLKRIQAICCTKCYATRKQIIDNIRSCLPPIMVLPCCAPETSADACDALLNLLQSLDWRAFAHNKYAGANRTASRAEGAADSANFVLGATKGVPNSCGYTHVVDKQHHSDNLRGLNLSVVKTAGRRQAPKLLAPCVVLGCL